MMNKKDYNFIRTYSGDVVINLDHIVDFAFDDKGIYCKTTGGNLPTLYRFKPGDEKETLFNNFIESLGVNIIKTTVKKEI